MQIISSSYEVQSYMKRINIM